MNILPGRPFDQLHALVSGRSYWGIALRRTPEAKNEWRSELDTKVSVRDAWGGNLQWYDDIVATGDIRYVKELWLFCPRSKNTPVGATCELDIHPGQYAFQIKGAACNIAGGGRYDTWQLIGRVDNPITGDSTCYVWDYLDGRCYKHQMNILRPVPWREHGPRIGQLNLNVVGLEEFARGIVQTGGMHLVHGISEYPNYG